MRILCRTLISMVFSILLIAESAILLIQHNIMANDKIGVQFDVRRIQNISGHIGFWMGMLSIALHFTTAASFGIGAALKKRNQFQAKTPALFFYILVKLHLAVTFVISAVETLGEDVGGGEISTIQDTLIATNLIMLFMYAIEFSCCIRDIIAHKNFEQL
jgi:hypothetical protein